MRRARHCRAPGRTDPVAVLGVDLVSEDLRVNGESGAASGGKRAGPRTSSSGRANSFGAIRSVSSIRVKMNMAWCTGGNATGALTRQCAPWAGGRFDFLGRFRAGSGEGAITRPASRGNARVMVRPGAPSPGRSHNSRALTLVACRATSRRRWSGSKRPPEWKGTSPAPPARHRARPDPNRPASCCLCADSWSWTVRATSCGSTLT